MDQDTYSTTPPVCSYEGSDYQDSFWETGTRRYEDAVEAVALKRLLTQPGELMLELGAGAGRNTSRYADWQRVVLLDYSRTQLVQARQRLGDSQRAALNAQGLQLRLHVVQRALHLVTLASQPRLVVA